MSIFIPVSTLIRLVFWLAAAGIVIGVLIGAQGRAADTSTSSDLVPTTVVQPTADQPAVEAASRVGR